MRTLLNATALATLFAATAAIAQTTEINDVTVIDGGVNIEADAGTTQVDAETAGPGTQEQPEVARTDINPNPVSEQLETNFAPEDTGTTGGTMGSTVDADRANARVRDLIGLEVVTDVGNDVGSITEVVKIDTEIAAVIELGGFLGLGEKQVAIALDDLKFGDAKLTLSGVDQAELADMSAHDADASEALTDDAAVIVYQ